MDNTKIIELEEKLLNAFQNCSTEILDELIHENAMFVLPNGLEVTKEIVLNNYRSGKTAFGIIAPHNQNIKMIDDCAIVTVVLNMQGKYEDQIISRKFQYIRVWKLCSKEWRVIATSGVQL